MLMRCEGLVQRLVRHIHLDEYVVKGHSDGSAETSDTYHRAIHARLVLVHVPRMAGQT